MSQRDTPDETKSSEPTLGSVDPALPKSSENDKYEYQCPYCDESYQHELLTRVHVTRSDDASHLNQNGMMPETDIRVINEDDELIETISRRPEEIDTSTVPTEMFPDDLPDHHKHILSIAAENVEQSTYSRLAEQVEDRLEDHDIKCPSYSTIRRVVRQFYRPKEETQKTESEDRETESLTTLTPKQQAIILARLVSPDHSTAKIAEQIGCANSYPTQVFKLADSIITDLEERIKQGEDPKTVIVEELTEDDIRELVKRNLVENIPIDLSTAVSENEDTASWGSPVGHNGGMSADPYEQDEQSQDTDSQSTTQIRASSDSDNESDGHQSREESVATVSEMDSCKSIPRGDIEAFQEKIRFLRKIFEPLNGEENEMVVSLARQVEEQCEDLLQDSVTER